MRVSFGMKWKINGLENTDWLSIVIFFILAFIISLAAYALVWYFITLLLDISFAWNHAVVFYIVCTACGGVNTKWEGV